MKKTKTKKEPARPALELGAEVVLILSKVVGRRSKSGNRRQVEGAARGTIVACLPDAMYRIKISLANPVYYVGREVEYPRGRIFALALDAERAEFDEIVKLYWSPRGT